MKYLKALVIAGCVILASPAISFADDGNDYAPNQFGGDQPIPGQVTPFSGQQSDIGNQFPDPAGNGGGNQGGPFSAGQFGGRQFGGGQFGNPDGNQFGGGQLGNQGGPGQQFAQGARNGRSRRHHGSHRDLGRFQNQFDDRRIAKQMADQGAPESVPVSQFNAAFQDYLNQNPSMAGENGQQFLDGNGGGGQGLRGGKGGRGGRGGKGGNKGARRQKLMQRFDTNGDGVLDDNERAQMRQFMQQRRANRQNGGGGRNGRRGRDGRGAGAGAGGGGGAGAGSQMWMGGPSL